MNSEVDNKHDEKAKIDNKHDEKAKIEISIPNVLSLLAFIMAFYAMILSRNNSMVIDQLTRYGSDEVNTDVSVKTNNLIPYPYFQTTQTVNGVTITDNGNRTLSVKGKCTEDSVVFRICSNDDVVEIPLEKKKYLFSPKVDEKIITNACKLDIGMMKNDGSKEVLHAKLDSNKKIMNDGNIIIDNTSGVYKGVYAISMYVFKDFIVPEDYTFNPSLSEIE